MKTTLIGLIIGLFASTASIAQVCDDFNIANTSTIPGWTEQSNDWSIESNMLKSPAATSWNFATKDGSTTTDGYVSGRAIHNGVGQTQFMGIAARYTSDVANIMFKVQDNSSAGYFNSYFLSCDNNNVLTVSTGLNLGTDLNFKMEFSGSAVYLYIDIERDGIWDIDTTVAVTNTGSGLCGAASYASCYLDDFCYFGCSAAPDPAGTITGFSNVCILETDVPYLVAPVSGATSYQWSYSGSDVTIHGNGNTVNLDFGPFATSGSLSVSGINPCGTGTVSAAFPVTVLELVTDAGLINGEDSVCQGQSTVLYDCGTLTNALDYIWSYSGTGVTITGNSNIVALDFAANATSGDLTVYGENACGAGPDSPGFSIYVHSCTGITEKENDFSISPNPGNGVFSVDFSGVSNEPADLKVINAIGQTVWSASRLDISMNPLIVDLSGQPVGTYIVRMICMEQVIDRKLVISR